MTSLSLLLGWPYGFDTKSGCLMLKIGERLSVVSEITESEFFHFIVLTTLTASYIHIRKLNRL
jgi:hypothetical protein